MKPFSIFPLRLTLGIMFFIFGIQKFFAFDTMTGYAAGVGLPLAGAAVIIAALLEIFGGLLIVIGLQARRAALVLALYLVLVILFFDLTILGTPLAGLADAGMINFLKNLALLGAALTLYLSGPGRWALDKM
ncbi:MAG TPA: DoxX family protein [Candidatus Nanoarchaeia archaeon]|nr:DoxX family protein [Candidatus Nanoarchaeia archaeon]